MPIRFEQFEIDDQHIELRHDGDVVPIEPLILKLIVYFSSNAHQVLDRDELMANVWPGKFVSDATISSAIKSARKALGDSGKQQRFIQTLHGRGFRFIADIKSVPKQNVLPDADSWISRNKSEQQPPSVAVVNFDNLSTEPSQDFFSDGISNDIIVRLTQFRGLKVITLPQSADVPQSHTETPADYLLHGGVRRANNDLRITVQLRYTSTGEIVWAEKYDRGIEDIFGVQDEVSRAVAATVDGRLNQHRVTVTRHASATELTVYELILRAQQQHYRMQKNANNEAHKLLSRALELDDQNHRVHSLLGVVHHIDYQMCWTADGTHALTKALEHGREAIKLDPTDSLAYARLADTQVLCEEYEEAEQHLQTALNLNPNDSETLALYAEYLRSTNKAAEALDMLSVVRTYDPFDRQWYPWLQGECLFQLNQCNAAITAFRNVSEPINDMRLTHAACYALLEDSHMASALVSDYLDIAQTEMPCFPGRTYEDWVEFRRPFIESRDPVYSLRMQALANCWPNP